MSSDITPDIPPAPGIYAIHNLLDGKNYVGSSANLRKRLRQHFVDLKAGRHANSHLQAAYSRDGRAAFEVRIICHVEDPAQLLEIEGRCIADMRAADRAHGYNKQLVPGRSNLGRTFPPEVVEKGAAKRRGVKQSPEWVEARVAPLRGRKLSPEHAAKVRLMNVGRPRPDVGANAARYAAFSDAAITAIRERYAAGATYRELADIEGCAPSTIRNVVLGIGPAYGERKC